MNIFFKIFLAVFLLLKANFFLLYAQASSGEASPTIDEDTILDEAPIISSRAAGLGGALSTLADDLDAAYYNPAGIGGLHWGKEKAPLTRKVYFPFVGAGVNKATNSVIKDFRSEDGTRDTTVGRTIINANEGERQYARATAAFGVVFGRLLVAPFTDHQIAAVSYGQDTDLIKARYRTLTGGVVGASVCDPGGRLYLGFSSFYLSRKETVGDFNYLDMLDKSSRNSAFNDASTKYTGVANNVGAIWRLADKGRPSLGLSVKNLGGTNYKSSSSDSEDLKVEQDFTVGFSYSPNLSKGWGLLNFIVEEDHISNKEISLHKKHKLGLEWLIGGMGSYTTFGLRTGYNEAGVSLGLTLNAGILALEVASQAEDIGVDNKRVTERRTIVTFGVNVAHF